MKLFLREQIPLALAYIAQVLFLLFILWLDGYLHFRIYFYAVLISSLLLLGYLTTRYLSMHSFYTRLSSPTPTLDESMDVKENTPLSNSLSSVLTSQYQRYKEELLRIENKMENHITFIHQWVHQMKTPLSVLYLLMQNHEPFDKKDIQIELDRLKGGLELILYLSRLENIETDLHIGSVQLESIVNQVVIEHKQLFFHYKLVPELNIDSSVTVISDPKWLSFILGQVVSNAIRYSAGTSTRILFSTSMKEKEVVLEITDFGIGIPKQDIRRVFDPYFTGEKGTTYGESTGMGLYLVREVCKHLQHLVEIESEEGQGTTVRFRFPGRLTKV